MSSTLVEQMREDISKVYPSSTWKRRVFYMEDNQVIAIYNNFVETGKFEKKPEPEKKVEERQLTIWDFIKEEV